MNTETVRTEAEHDVDIKARFLAETDAECRWDLLNELHERGWAFRPFNAAEPFVPRRGHSACASPGATA